MAIALVACLALAWQGGGDPEAALRGRGLQLVGRCWLLPEDIEAEPEAKRLLGEIGRLQRDQVQSGSEVARIRQVGAARARQIQQLRGTDPRDPSWYQKENDRLRLEGDQATAGVRLSILGDRMTDNALAIERYQDELAILYQDIMSAYDRLNSDKAVAGAILEINRSKSPWQALGPAMKYDVNVAALAMRVMKENGLVRKGARWSFPGDADLNPMMARASVLWNRQKLQGGKAKGELSSLIAEIRGHHGRIMAAYEEVRGDPLVRGALIESNRRAKSPAEVSPQRDFERIPRRLDEMEVGS